MVSFVIYPSVRQVQCSWGDSISRYPNAFMWYVIILASYPGLPSQLFLQPWNAFFHGCKKSCEGRPGYEAMIILSDVLWKYSVIHFNPNCKIVTVTFGVLDNLCSRYYRRTGFNCDNLIIANALFFLTLAKIRTHTQLLNTQYASKTWKRNDFTTQLKPVLRYNCAFQNVSHSQTNPAGTSAV